MITSFTPFAMVARLQWFYMGQAEEEFFFKLRDRSMWYEQRQKKESIIENINITQMTAL
jgi:hypothetical protein